MPEEKKAESKMYGICTVVAGRITGGKGKNKQPITPHFCQLGRNMQRMKEVKMLC